MKKVCPRVHVLTACATVLLFFSGNASGQTQFDKKAFLKQLLDASAKAPAKPKSLFSAGMQNMLQLAAALNSTHSKLGGDAGTVIIPPKVAAAARTAVNALSAASAMESEGPGETIKVSDPSLDFVNSALTSFTQSESSSGWCGNAVVTGYNDSGAFARTAGVNFFGAWSLDGASYSTNGGRSFVDIGFVNPGSDPANFLAGDPVIACSSPNQFYYSSIFFTATPPDINGFRFPLSAIAVNSSSNGGQSWSDPVSAIAKDGFSHSLDKPWMAVDPSNHSRLYVTYTDFDFSFNSAGCPNDFRLAIELVSSSDGGQTWTSPAVIDEQCGASFNGVQGSNPAVASDGTLYVGYEFVPGLVPNNEIHVSRSNDHGATFGAPVKVSNVWPNGNFGLLQGGFRNNEFPQVAVDRSKGPSKGTVYVAWSDGINHIVPDLPFFFDSYAYPDIMMAKSTDGGQTFSAPTIVSPVQASFTGRGRDQFFPGVAVDKSGKVGICYYDRRADPLNTVIDRYCSISENHGMSWNEQRVSSANWVPMHFSDGIINAFYIGDYDALASDFLMQHGGFFGSFEVQTNGNPDVVAQKVNND